jgi:hypothetical protein
MIPGIASVIGPTVGSFMITDFSFTFLFAISMVLYSIALAVSLRIKFAIVLREFTVPTGKVFQYFFATFILWGFIERC